jgi:hypothetical protein
MSDEVIDLTKNKPTEDRKHGTLDYLLPCSIGIALCGYLKWVKCGPCWINGMRLG